MNDTTNRDFDFDAAMLELETPLTVAKPAPTQADSDWNAGIDNPTPRRRPVRRNKHADAIRRAERQAKKLAGDKADFIIREPGVVEFLAANSHWSTFFASLSNQFETKGFLSDKQVRVVRSAQLKLAERAEVKRREMVQKSIAVDLTPIEKMFEHARQAGLKRTVYRAEGLVLSPASAASRNAGAIYVKRESSANYLGKVVDGRFQPILSQTTERDHDAIAKIAKDPKEAAVQWGKKTGRCSCCGRELTDPSSIEAGIGPVCATKWNL